MNQLEFHHLFKISNKIYCELPTLRGIALSKYSTVFEWDARCLKFF